MYFSFVTSVEIIKLVAIEDFETLVGGGFASGCYTLINRLELLMELTE